GFGLVRLANVAGDQVSGCSQFVLLRGGAPILSWFSPAFHVRTGGAFDGSRGQSAPLVLADWRKSQLLPLFSVLEKTTVVAREGRVSNYIVAVVVKQFLFCFLFFLSGARFEETLDEPWRPDFANHREADSRHERTRPAACVRDGMVWVGGAAITCSTTDGCAQYAYRRGLPPRRGRFSGGYTFLGLVCVFPRQRWRNTPYARWRCGWGGRMGEFSV
ncbi:unnamed protein product, partial [Ectocarpus sp. 13 AM-2016]